MAESRPSAAEQPDREDEDPFEIVVGYVKPAIRIVIAELHEKGVSDGDIVLAAKLGQGAVAADLWEFIQEELNSRGLADGQTVNPPNAS